MNFIRTIGDWIVAIKDAKNAGLTNDASLMTFFRSEYKNDAVSAYEYWKATDGCFYTK